MLRIIAGKHRGRRIESHHEKALDKELRPTAGRTREALFNILLHGQFAEESPLIDKRVIDIFCGTGALGFEALSRGAAHVTFVDKNPKSLDLARKTAERFGENENVVFIRSDSTHIPPARTPCSLAFLDPPYHSGIAERGLKSLASGGWLEENAVIVVEQAKTEPVTIPEHFTQIDERIYDITKVIFLRYKRESGFRAQD